MSASMFPLSSDSIAASIFPAWYKAKAFLYNSDTSAKMVRANLSANSLAYFN